ncbi:hypothetical protein H0E87_027396 [Populus deltoides]|uniref:Uncharacterized protein n=1 Tax=Populus deltoides TaxID=3696 RepID=A0A8T2WZV0_POPDE|nr:hypothetical protein H0E87_027396 [Populus deltoides]
MQNRERKMKPRQEQEEDEERLHQRKLEESLEIKSLRRIISAYLNYPEAAEEDVKKYERSFRKLPPSHKVGSWGFFSLTVFLKS